MSYLLALAAVTAIAFALGRVTAPRPHPGYTRTDEHRAAEALSLDEAEKRGWSGVVDKLVAQICAAIAAERRRKASG